MVKERIIIVAGGLGTRMHPITETIPKCLVDINGMPLIERQLRFFKKKGYSEFIFCIAHLAEKVKEHFEKHAKDKYDITFVEEQEELRGTAGSVKLSQKLFSPEENFIVFYGDNFTSMDFDKFISSHKKNNALMTLCLRVDKKKERKSDLILLEKSNKMTTFKEKPSQEEVNRVQELGKKIYANNGIFACSAKIFKHIPENKKYDFSKELIPTLLAQNKEVYGYPTEEFYHELGRTEKYQKFLEAFKAKQEILQ